MANISTNPKVAVLEKIYSDFSKGDLQGVLAACSDAVTFQIPGKSKLAGKYTKATFIPEFAMRMHELSGGTLKVEIHDILASDQHAAVLATDRLTRNGKTLEYRTVHIWRFEPGTHKPLAWYEYPRDLYQYDEVWG